MIGNLDPTKVTVACGGRFLTGYAADGIFNLVWNADRVTYTAGSQGDGVYVEGADNSAILTVSLSPTSPSVPYLEDLCSRRTFFPTTVNDATADGRLTYTSQKCRVQKFADKSRNNAAPTTTYNIIMPNAVKTA